MKRILVALSLCIVAPLLGAAELSGVSVADEIKAADGQKLVLNGIGLREKFWVDVYVGSLYLPRKSENVAEILSAPGPWRIQLDFVYKEVSSEKLLEAWREGFEKNQPAETLAKLKSRIDQFNRHFETSAVAGDRFVFNYMPGKGTQIIKNDQELDLIAGEDFKNALLEIWLGNYPADKNLKRSMLGIF